MLVISEQGIGHIIEAWLKRFNAALAAGDKSALGALFRTDSHWRDIVALGRRIRTVSGQGKLVDELLTAVQDAGARDFAIDDERTAPRFVERAGEDTIEAILRFETKIGTCAALLRLKRAEASGDAPVAWVLTTALDSLRGFDVDSMREAREEPAFEREFNGPNWLDKRREAARFEGRDPAVLIVGGGHAGVTAAAWLGALNIEALIVDRMARVGDNWRLRYHGLKLHNQVHSNHFPFLSFPKTWPKYIPKDKIANWIESYVETMEINFWTKTSFEGATYDASAKCWVARLKQADGSERIMRPRHIIMATSVSGTPNLPDIPTLDRFKGKVVHSSGFKNGAEWKDKPVYVFGTGTSAHDITQDLHGNGAKVTMVQRSPTLIVNVEPSAQLYDGVYCGKGPTLEDRDLINVSFPLSVMKQAHKILTDKTRELDKPLLDGLEKIGFRLEFGDNGTGWPLKYRSRGGGYYFNVGCSDLLVRREVGLIQYHDIAEFNATGMRMKDGRELPAALLVLATGYKGQDHLVRGFFGDAVAERVGKVWGFDEADQELRNMWMETPQQGLWFTGGSFAQCRMYSKYLAMQIKAREEGLV